MKTKPQKKEIIIYLTTVLLAVMFLYAGNKVASKGIVKQDGFRIERLTPVKAKIVNIIDTDKKDGPGQMTGSVTTTFTAVIKSGERKNESVVARQTLAGYFVKVQKKVAKGDKVLLTSLDNQWYFTDYVRIDKIIILCVIFVALLLFFGQVKGLNTILSLGFTCAAIFAVFIPSILSGKNIYMSSVIVCAYSIVITLFILNGVNRKSIAAVAGCLGGVIAAGLLAFFMNGALALTGMTDKESMQLLYLPMKNPIDLKAVIFAGIIIGAVGAIMDVAVSISSALFELKTKAPALQFNDIFKSGINIGKDIMGSMTNTLILAYIGSSMSIILLLIVYVPNLTELLNREMVVVELLQAVVGSLGILLTMPLTALVCAALYTGGKVKKIDVDFTPRKTPQA